MITKFVLKIKIKNKKIEKIEIPDFMSKKKKNNGILYFKGKVASLLCNILQLDWAEALTCGKPTMQTQLRTAKTSFTQVTK